MTRPLFLALAVFAFLTPVARRAAAAEDLKIGYVDLQRALGETEDGRKARANLKKVFDQKQKEIDEQQEELKKAVDDLQKKRTLLSADTVRQKEAELQDRMQKVQQTYLRHQNDLQAKEREVTEPIIARLNAIVQKMAAAENFTYVFNNAPGLLVFAKPHLDLTNEVIRRYNSGEAAGAKAPAAPAKK